MCIRIADFCNILVQLLERKDRHKIESITCCLDVPRHSIQKKRVPAKGSYHAKSLLFFVKEETRKERKRNKKKQEGPDVILDLSISAYTFYFYRAPSYTVS